MSTIPGVTSTMWGLSTAGPGQIVQGIDEVNQTISTIICTQPGSDCLRPLFGCGLLDLIDRPSNVVAPSIAQAMAAALRVWEPRIEVLKIKYSVMESNIFFTLTWKMRVGSLYGQADVLVGLLDNLVKSALFEDLTPYLSAVLSTETFEPLTTETGDGLAQ